MFVHLSECAEGEESFTDHNDEPEIMGRTYHTVSVGRESFEIDTRLVI